jgi:Flp pilus assembly pilin Flp
MPWLQATLARGPANEEDPEGGQGLAEYALILAFIAIAVIGALAFFGEQLLGVLSGQIGSSVSDVVQGMP